MTSSPSRPRPISPGDPVPALCFRDADGGQVWSDDQAVSGRVRVIWHAGPKADGAAWARLGTALPAFREYGAEVLVVGDAVPAAPAEGGLPGVPRLADPDRQLAGLFGGAVPALVILDEGGRLAARLEGEDFAAALGLCKRLHERTPAETVSAQAPVLLLDGVLEPEFCRALITYWRENEKVADRVSSSYGGATRADQAIKRRADVMLAHMGLAQPVKQRIERRVLPEIFRAFGWKATRMEAIRIGCYDAAEGGYFRRHRDNTTPYTAHRRFAMSLNLNAGDYAGGAIRFPEYGRQLYAPPAGGAVIFGCGLLHEAMPVVMGRRFGLFTFFYDEAGAAENARVVADRPEEAAAATVTMRGD